MVLRTTVANLVNKRVWVATRRRRGIIVIVCRLWIILVRTLLRNCSRISRTRCSRHGAGVDKGRCIRGIIHPIATWIVIIDRGCFAEHIARRVHGIFGRECQIGTIIIIIISEFPLSVDEVDETTDQSDTYKSNSCKGTTNCAFVLKKTVVATNGVKTASSGYSAGSRILYSRCQIQK